MFQRKLATVATRFAVLLLCLSTIWYSATTYAQTGDSIAELKERATALSKQTRYTEASPLLEKIVVAEPDKADYHEPGGGPKSR